MTEGSLFRHRGTCQVYNKYASNAEREILDILQNFEREKSVTFQELLRDGLTDKLNKIKAIDDSVLA